MWKIETSGGLGQIWPTPNSWEEGEEEEEKLLLVVAIESMWKKNRF